MTYRLPRWMSFDCRDDVAAVEGLNLDYLADALSVSRDPVNNKQNICKTYVCTFDQFFTYQTMILSNFRT